MSFFAKPLSVNEESRSLRTPELAGDGAGQVLREQFDYLLEHSKLCTSYCRDCARFRRIAEVLMEPFHSEQHRVKASRTAIRTVADA